MYLSFHIIRAPLAYTDCYITVKSQSWLDPEGVSGNDENLRIEPQRGPGTQPLVVIRGGGAGLITVASETEHLQFCSGTFRICEKAVNLLHFQTSVGDRLPHPPLYHVTSEDSCGDPVSSRL